MIETLPSHHFSSHSLRQFKIKITQQNTGIPIRRKYRAQNLSVKLGKDYQLGSKMRVKRAGSSSFMSFSFSR